MVGIAAAAGVMLAGRHLTLAMEQRVQHMQSLVRDVALDAEWVHFAPQAGRVGPWSLLCYIPCRRRWPARAETGTRESAQAETPRLPPQL